MIIQLNEVTNLTTEMVPHGELDFAVSEATQRLMLASFLNLAEEGLKFQKELTAKGLVGQIDLPKVTVTYGKVTKAKARIANVDFGGIPGVATDTHTGTVVKVARNKEGRLYFTILDDNRATRSGSGFTAIRLEGIRTFHFADQKAQKKALDAANVALAT